MDALEQSDACIMVLPCGPSASMEMGWACGAGKPTVSLYPRDARTRFNGEDGKYHYLIDSRAFYHTLRAYVHREKPRSSPSNAAT